MTRAYSWCFTINNYTETDTNSLVQWMDTKTPPKYLLYAPEISETGTPHYQGYVMFKNARTMSAVAKYLKRANLSEAKGNAQHNLSYIKGPYDDGKGKTKPLNTDCVEQGEIPQQGKRTDINEVCALVQGGANMREIIPQATSYQSIRMAEISLKYFEKPRETCTKLYWFHGPTGTGKTSSAYELCEDPYICMGTSKWWEGYDGQDDVIIDDYRRDFCKFHELLRLFDYLPLRVECKGGSRQFRAKRVFITTPYDIDQTWEGRTAEDIKQLKRRCVLEIPFLSLTHKPLDYYALQKEYSQD